MAKYYRRADNSFAGTWVDGAPTDDTLVEVNIAPDDGRMVWDGAAWVMPAPIAKTIANAPILEDIELKEKRALRRMREMLLRLAQATVPANDPDRVALEQADAQIAAKRTELVP